MNLGIPPLEVKILLESKPWNSRSSVCELAVWSVFESSSLKKRDWRREGVLGLIWDDPSDPSEGFS